MAEKVGKYTVAIGEGKPRLASKNAISPIYRCDSATDRCNGRSGSPSIVVHHGLRHAPHQSQFILAEHIMRRRPTIWCGNFRNVAAKDGFPTMEGATTLYEVFENSVKTYSDKQCLGFRPMVDGKAGPYQWWTYKQTHGALLGPPSRELYRAASALNII